MPKVLKMPSVRDVPSGPRRDFVEELFELFRLAGRPTLNKVSDQILSVDRPGTASRETVRRALTSGAVPTRWFTAHAIFVALCELAGLDPSSDRWDAEQNWRDDSPMPTRLEHFKTLWNRAIDDEPPQPDPWAVRDEPPF